MLYRLFSYSYSYRINAGGIGDGRDGKPRQSSIFRIASGGLTAQRILIVLPHLLHFSASTANTRFKSSAHAYRQGRDCELFFTVLPSFICFLRRYSNLPSASGFNLSIAIGGRPILTAHSLQPHPVVCRYYGVCVKADTIRRLRKVERMFLRYHGFQDRRRGQSVDRHVSCPPGLTSASNTSDVYRLPPLFLQAPSLRPFLVICNALIASKSVRTVPIWSATFLSQLHSAWERWHYARLSGIFYDFPSAIRTRNHFPQVP